VDEADLRARRESVLRSLGGDPAAIPEVTAYCESKFRAVLPPAPVFPLAEEPHVADWRRYAQEAGDHAFAYLRERLAQLQIPVREGVSKLPAYADVVQRGLPFEASAFDGTLALDEPEGVRLLLHEHPAGALPVLVVPHRGDFETLVRALAFRGEPKPISPAVNAQLVAGFVNWDRMRRYRAEWSAAIDPSMVETLWPMEMGRVASGEKWRYQDRFMITGVRAYSSVGAAALGLELPDAEWVDRSTTLRVEHEFTHYATQRVYGAMSLNLLDETIADFMGATYALGRFRGAWLLAFLGLEDGPQVREDGRMRTYAGDLSPAAFDLVARLMIAAAPRLEEIGQRFYDARERGRFLLALASLTLELYAAPDALALFEQAYVQAASLAGPPAA
jgi:hypothetical protein